LSTDVDSRRSLEAILFSFGGSVQDAEHRPALKSPQTLEAMKFFKALYDEAMTSDVLTWDDASNNRAMLAEEISLTLNPINIIRTAENLHWPVAAKLALAKAPQGPVRRLVPTGGSYWIGIWKFAENIDSAKQFLVDFVGASRQAFLASQFRHFPAYPQTVPDLAHLLADDPSAQPPSKYRLLADAADWTIYSGYPSYTNAAIHEISGAGLLQQVFIAVVTGQMSPEEALTQADQEVRKIYQKWQDLGRI
jgi:multiple sugar transport system substrate-binding protein